MNSQSHWPCGHVPSVESVDEYLARKLSEELSSLQSEAWKLDSDADLLTIYDKVMEIRGLRRALLQRPEESGVGGTPTYLSLIHI